MKLTKTENESPQAYVCGIPYFSGGVKSAEAEDIPSHLSAGSRQRSSAKADKGFTLVELLLYIGLAATIVFIVSFSFSMILSTRVKNQTIAEVEQNGAQVMEILTQTIRNADNINSPAQGVTGSSLNLDVIDGTKDPTIFDLPGTIIRIKEGSSSYVSLTSDRITALNLSFYNLSRTNTPGTLRIQFTLTHINPGGRNEYNYSKTFYGTASLRQ